jgi:hypothetical protein
MLGFLLFFTETRNCMLINLIIFTIINPKNYIMSDDLSKKPEDATKVNLNESWELDYWSKKFGVTKEKLKEAVKAVGTSAAAVQKYLGK